MLIAPISLNKHYIYSTCTQPCHISFTGQLLTFDEIEERIKEADINAIKQLKDVSVINKKFDSLLHVGARYNQTEICRYLLNKKQNPNQKNLHGKTPFSIACSRNNKALVQTFLIYGANVNTQDNLKNTPLHLCTNSPEITKILLDYNANPYLPNDFGQTAFANTFTKPQTLEVYLKHGVNPNTIDLNKQTLLHKAIINNRLDIADLLERYRAEINYKDKWGKSPIFYSNNIETLDWLIQNNANINLTDKNKQTVLHQSVINNNLNFTNELLKRKANPNVKDKKELPPLAYAKTINMMKLLLQHGANPDIQTPNSRYLLHNCAKTNNLKAVNLLTIYKANPNVIDKDGNCPMDLTTNNDIKILLLAAGSNPNFKTYLIDALKNKNSEFADLLLECGANPDKIDEAGNSSVFYINNENDLLTLIKNNANLNLYNKYGYTPMLHFALLGNRNLVEVIKQHGAQNLKSLNNETIEDCYKKYETYSKWLNKNKKSTSFKGRAYYEYGTDSLRKNLNYKTQLTTAKIDETIENAPNIDIGLIAAYKLLSEEEKKIYVAMQSLAPVIKHFSIMVKDNINKIASKNPSGSKIPVVGIIKQYHDTVFSNDFIKKIKEEAWNIKNKYEDIVENYYTKNISELISNYTRLNEYLSEGIKYVNYVEGESKTREKLLINLKKSTNNCSVNNRKLVSSLNKTSKKYEELVNKLVNIQDKRQNKRTARKTVIKIITLGMS